MTNPQRLWDYAFIKSFAPSLRFSQSVDLILPVTLLFSAAAVFAASIRLINLWFNGRMAAAIGTDLSISAYKSILYQPYIVHINRNTSELISTIVNQIASTVVSVNSFLQLLTAVFVSLGIFSALFLVNSIVAGSTFFVFGSVYAFWPLFYVADYTLTVTKLPILHVCRYKLCRKAWVQFVM